MEIEKDLVLKLKNEGNDLFKKEKFNEAIVKYSEALKHDSDNAVLYSNRSLSYLKLEMYREALDDAIKCIRSNPRWFKGYIRKTMALRGLRDHTQVMKSVEEAFKFCTEARVKRDIVDYWLTANQALYALPEGCMELPKGILVLSKSCLEILACLRQSLNGEQPLEYNLMECCLCKCAEEMETILTSFGENTSPIIRKWAKLLPHEIYPYHINPTKPKKDIKIEMDSRNALLIEFINKEVDPAVYPILRPLFGLVVLIILNRCNILTECNTSHHSAELMNEALLPLFESSLLSHDDYYSMYVGRICAILDSFIGRGSKPTEEDLSEVQFYCQKLRKAIQKYPRHLPEFQKDSEMADRVLSNICQNVLIQPPFKLLSTSSAQRVVSVEIAEQMVHKKPNEVKAYITKHLKSLEAAEFLTMGEIEELISMAGIFHKLGDKAEAFRVFTKGEQGFFKVFGHLLSSHTLNLDQCPAAITPIRQLVLNQALLFPDVFPDVALRWKCLFKEFRLQLIRRSSGNLFEPFFQWYATQIASIKDVDADDSHAILEQHLKKEKQLLEAEAKQVLLEHSQLSYKDVQNVLGKDMVTVDFVFFAPLQQQSAALLNAYCVICQKEGKPIVCQLNFKLIRTYTARIFYLLSSGSKSHKFLQDNLLMLAGTLLPKNLLEILAKGDISRIYVSPDFDISKLPLDILPVSIGSRLQTPLYELFSVSLLPSIKHLVSSKHKFISEDKFPSTKSCCIIGNPNFNLRLPSLSESAFENLISFFCEYLSISPQSGPVVEQLTHSQSEIDFVSFCLQKCGCEITYMIEDNATFGNVMSVQNPLLVHISSHASGKSEQTVFRGNFFSDLDCAIALAGFNTFSKKQFEMLPTDCGPARLPPLAIYSMKLEKTKLVFLSTCNSATGELAILEAINSLADAFITAGVETVIATLWPVADESAATFTKFFYDKLVQPGTRPSQAITYAKTIFTSSSVGNDLECPAAFVCYGIDNPVLPLV